MRKTWLGIAGTFAMALALLVPVAARASALPAGNAPTALQVSVEGQEPNESETLESPDSKHESTEVTPDKSNEQSPDTGSSRGSETRPDSPDKGAESGDR